MYRQDVSIKYQKYREAKVASSRRDESRKPPKAQTTGAMSRPTCVEQILLQNAWDHLKAVCGDYGFISMPQRPDCETQLITRSFSDLLYSDEKPRATKLHDNKALMPYDADTNPHLCFRVLSRSLGKLKTMASCFPRCRAQAR